MGTKRPDQISTSHWRGSAETVLEMFRRHWEIISICRHCRVMLQVDLRVVAVLKGRDFSLWNQHTPCRRWPPCPGVLDFQFKAPGMTQHKPLAAPDREPTQAMGHVERAFAEERARRLAAERMAQARRIVLRAAPGDSGLDTDP